MDEGVKSQEAAAPESKMDFHSSLQSEKARENFARLEAAREAEKEARIRAEMQAKMLQDQIEEIKSYMKPKEKDPLDDIAPDEVIDQSRLRAIREKDRASFKREAEEIANKTYETRQKQDRQRQEDEDKANYLTKLRGTYQDYDTVMANDNLLALHNADPIFVKTLEKIPDDYERRSLAYEYIKTKNIKSEPQQTIKEKVEENAKNPFFIQGGTGAPSAMDYDLKSPQARKAAYQKLKEAQKRPIGSGQVPLAR